MNDLAPLFALFALLAAALASVAIWSPRRFSVRLTALALAGAMMPAGYAALAELLSQPKPVGFEWWRAKAEEAHVLAATMREEEAIYLWLLLPGLQEPRAYVLPWDRSAAEQLRNALAEAEERQTGVTMRMPFEPSLDDRQPRFYALPQPALPPKPDEGGPPARRFNAPERSA
jgi:hypothetical protein